MWHGAEPTPIHSKGTAIVSHRRKYDDITPVDKLPEGLTAAMRERGMWFCHNLSTGACVNPPAFQCRIGISAETGKDVYALYCEGCKAAWVRQQQRLD